MKKEEIDLICQEYDITNYTINDDGSIDVDGDVYLCDMELTELPLKFGKVTGYFNCSYNKLTSLEGSPKWIGGDFDCGCNHLTSLEGGPETVISGYCCGCNHLTSLEGCPEYVGGDFICDYIDNEFVTIHEVYCLFDHKSFIKQYKRDQKLNELLGK